MVVHADEYRSPALPSHLPAQSVSSRRQQAWFNEGTAAGGHDQPNAPPVFIAPATAPPRSRSCSSNRHRGPRREQQLSCETPLTRIRASALPLPFSVIVLSTLAIAADRELTRPFAQFGMQACEHGEWFVKTPFAAQRSAGLPIRRRCRARMPSPGIELELQGSALCPPARSNRLADAPNMAAKNCVCG